ncbi:MAG: efflux RND transporter periplasmic adaptor subunit [Clostridia bacterium]|nr:efflux RND transporter periplasmic adaptor subunit [Clostridia bacterium]
MRRSTVASLSIGITVLFMGFATHQDEAITVQTAVIRTGDFLQTLPMIGTVEYEQQHNSFVLRNGKIAKVYVRKGQKVKAGELLFALDMSDEENAMTKLSQLRYQQQSIRDMGSVANLMTLQSEYELLRQEVELKQRIKASHMRSEAEGVVEAVYIKEGTYAQTGELAVVVRGEEKCIKVLADPSELAGIDCGTAAVMTHQGQYTGAAKIERIGAPVMTTEGIRQQITLVPMDGNDLDLYEAGTSISVKVLTDSIPSQALIPLAAIDSNERVWMIENDRVYSVGLENGKYNNQFVAVPMHEWDGRQVVLLPDQYRLQEGCAVKNAKK